MSEESNVWRFSAFGVFGVFGGFGGLSFDVSWLCAVGDNDKGSFCVGPVRIRALSGTWSGVLDPAGLLPSSG